MQCLFAAEPARDARSSSSSSTAPPPAVEEQSRRFGEIAGEFGCTGFEWATRPEDRSRLWKARHDAYFAARALRPTAKGISTDVCVPISRLAACIGETKADIVATGLIAPIVGHVGDGNFHVLPLIDFGDPAEVARGTAFVDRLVRRALAFGGTSTGEHGIGQSNRKYMRLEFDEAALGDDARDQTGARPGRHHEPGQGDSGLGSAGTRSEPGRIWNLAPLMVVSTGGARPHAADRVEGRLARMRRGEPSTAVRTRPGVELDAATGSLALSSDEC